MSANYCNCPNCRTENCPAGDASQPDGQANCAVADGSAWTRAVPTQGGYYWWRELPTEKAHIVVVGDAEGAMRKLYVWNGPYSNAFADVYGGGQGEWSGPLLPPNK